MGNEIASAFENYAGSRSGLLELRSVSIAPASGSMATIAVPAPGLAAAQIMRPAQIAMNGPNELNGVSIYLSPPETTSTTASLSPPAST